MIEAGQEQESSSGLSVKLLLLGVVLTFVGVMVIVVSVLLSGDADVSGGAIIFVGPIPIILGAGTDAFLAIVLAAVLTIIGFIVFFWMRRQVSKG
jgi:uncharacterized membrane protein